jgi:hypothetical protein
MPQFEYKVLEAAAKGFWGGKINSQELVNKLNEFGRQGWEVVSAADTNMWEGASRNMIIILKREITNV